MEWDGPQRAANSGILVFELRLWRMGGQGAFLLSHLLQW
jgi:hypothetical protein